MVSVAGQIRLDANRADAIWEEYQRTHDVSGRTGQAVGIDPDTGDVFFGRSVSSIVNDLEDAGCGRPLVYWRVGSRVYARLRLRRQA